MTAPAPAIKVRGLGRHYPDPARVTPEEWQHVLECDGMETPRRQCTYCPVDRSYPSVTNIKKALAQDWMKPWVARLMAEYMVENHEFIGRMAAKDYDKAVRWCKSEPFDQAYNAAERGTSLHDYVERRAQGETPRSAASDLKPSAHSRVRPVEQFLKDYVVEFRGTEKTVYSDRGYAGTLDAIVRLSGPKIPDGVYVTDWKTSKRIYADVALQVAALRHADRILEDVELGEYALMPETDGAVAVAFTEEGQYEARIVKDSERDIEVYAHLIEVWKWHNLPLGQVLSRPIRPASPIPTKRRK